MPRKIRLTPVRLLVLGYLAVILIGTLLLIIPSASKITGSASFMDALFTTVSASCVTGLIVCSARSSSSASSRSAASAL